MSTFLPPADIRSKKDWSTDEGKRSGTRNNSDKRRGSNTDNGSGSSNKDWAMSVSMCVRVISVGNDGGHQAGENDESLKKVEFKPLKKQTFWGKISR